MPAPLPDNLVRNRNRRGEYIGFCALGPQRIIRESGWWRSLGAATPGGQDVYALTRNLIEMSKKLEEIQ